MVPFSKFFSNTFCFVLHRESSFLFVFMDTIANRFLGAFFTIFLVRCYFYHIPSAQRCTDFKKYESFG